MTSAEKQKDKRLRETYGITLAAQDTQKIFQNNECAICGRSFTKYTAFQDHEHKCCPRKLKKFCGKCNRGLLCFPCNKFVVGVLERQSIDGVAIPPLVILKKMVAYFEIWNPILLAKGCYDEKPQVKKRASRRNEKSVRSGNESLSRSERRNRRRRFVDYI